MENVSDSESVASEKLILKGYVIIKAATEAALEALAVAALHEVAARHNVAPYYLRAYTRVGRIMTARHEAYRAVKDATGWSACRTARFFGRNPKTVYHSLTRHGGN